MKLTHAERLLLWNQYEILKHLDPEDAKGHEERQQIVSNGYELFYSELNPSVYEETTSDDVTREVIEILGMFRAIHFSAEKHNYTPRSRFAQFDGFDANESTGHYGFAYFLRHTQGKWDELSSRPNNSHSSTTLPHYREMLKRWRALESRHELSAAEIEVIAG